VESSSWSAIIWQRMELTYRCFVVMELFKPAAGIDMVP
jgi:hypothetical protein